MENRRGIINYDRALEIVQVYLHLLERVRVPVLRYFGKLKDELGKTPFIIVNLWNGVSPSLRIKGIIYNNKGRFFYIMINLNSGLKINIISTRLV